MTLALDLGLASRLATTALDNVRIEYPNKPDHVLGSPADLVVARTLHPAFYGSYDWHSCVHMHWTLARLRRLFPALPERARIEATFDEHLAPGPIGAECAYLARPNTASFERTYGWAWALELARELALAEDDRGRAWSRAIRPLADAFTERWLSWLPRAHYPIRHGTHANSAFGLALALDYARAAGRDDLESACVAKAIGWYGSDRDAPIGWEPSGADFLSPVLMEADLMRRVLPRARYAEWLARFLPTLARGESALPAPAEVADRTDPQIVHLDGLNLSRAWCLRGIAGGLAQGDPRSVGLLRSAERHASAGAAGLDNAHYLGSHWLASFALLAASG